MPTTQPERAAHHQAVEPASAEIAAWLIERVPLGMLAEITGVKETRALHDWAAGRHAPDPPQELRLRVARQLVGLVEIPGRPWVPRAWLSAPMPPLYDASPLSLLRNLSADDEERAAVMRSLVDTALLLHDAVPERDEQGSDASITKA